MVGMIKIDKARWMLAWIWFPASALIFLLLIGQSIGGVYESEMQRVWGWALPNFLPTLGLMLSVFAADALRPSSQGDIFVRRKFSILASCLSGFYLFLLLLSILAQPFLQLLRGTDIGAAARIQMLENSNFWLGPIQGLVAVVLGVLFFLKESNKSQNSSEAEGG